MKNKVEVVMSLQVANGRTIWKQMHEGYKGAIAGQKTCVVECWKILWVEKQIRGRSNF